MTVIVYGDFNCPYSYLASQRADELNRTATEMVGWRAVEHDRGLALTGTPSDRDQAAWERELAEVARLALPGEHVPPAGRFSSPGHRLYGGHPRGAAGYGRSCGAGRILPSRCARNTTASRSRIWTAIPYSAVSQEVNAEPRWRSAMLAAPM